MLSLPANPLAARRAWLIALVIAVTATVPPVAASTAVAAPSKPTIVLVHGAFADASGWNRVTNRLQRRGYKVVAPANPLRGVSADAAYLRSVLAGIKGQIVLVGHSYGGVVITNAATGNPNVKSLVYVAAYAPDQGQSSGSLGEAVPGGLIGPMTLDFHHFPNPDGSEGTEATIKTDVFREIFAADLNERLASAMAAAQRPASVVTLGEPTGVPAWRTIPSWAVIPTADKAIGVALLRSMAEHAEMKTVSVTGASHVVMVSRPTATAKVILDAAGPAARR